ncbi:MAG: hypothetical protein ACXAAH_12455 [Promethearchaeota archaeon]|jgi:hypothetical protein
MNTKTKRTVFFTNAPPELHKRLKKFTKDENKRGYYKTMETFIIDAVREKLERMENGS